ncbi:unnamed protein product, partial [Didymodactylos carnosus]
MSSGLSVGYLDKQSATQFDLPD